MVVGEAPGPEECKVGKPFIGPAGQFLRTALQTFEADPSALRITNTVKVFPGRTKRGRIRRPTRTQLEEGLPVLREEVREVQPEVILALGVKAIRTLTGCPRVEDARRRLWLPLRDDFGHAARVLGTYHPSYIRGFGRALEPMWRSDIKRFVIACRESARDE
jgi:DNA polymerase